MSVTGRIREFLKAFVKGEALNFPTTIRSSSRINNGRTLRDDCGHTARALRRIPDNTLDCVYHRQTNFKVRGTYHDNLCLD